MSAELDAAIDVAEREFMDLWEAGPQRLTWESTPVMVGDVAPAFELPDQTGRMTTLGQLISDSPLILLFWRHYGCGCGSDRADRLRSELRRYREVGATVAIVGQGLSVQAAAYADEQSLDVPILTDTHRRVYEAYGLLEATQPQLLFDAPQWLWSYSRETAERFVEARRETGRRLVNNPWQLPGEFVIRTDGVIAHAHRYQHCEDFPDPRILMTAATGRALD